MRHLICIVALLASPAAWGADLDTDLSHFKKWGRVAPEIAAVAEGRTPKLTSLALVNRKINEAHPYRSDLEVYGQDDYWATPAEFAAKGGDCEDFAISKYDALARLGVKDEDMLLLVVKDIATQELHALLQVRHEGNLYVLDSRNNGVHDERYLRYFFIFYGINRLGWTRGSL